MAEDYFKTSRTFEIFTENGSHIVTNLDIVAAAESFSEEYPEDRIIRIDDCQYFSPEDDVLNFISYLKYLEEQGLLNVFLFNNKELILKLKSEIDKHGEFIKAKYNDAP